ncbi:flagellar assembly protein FliH [Halobacillus litoralis]|uniref:flagellar assembly protein FliH n=1 Tax=Halobacillus litoralis TaxID=45668 RepID=UPI001CD39784|nr:flagellar assembly protein FliH [Halobacillus litoralis]MCA0969142.1 flagellar assembly protein FliH [Halobacillus litoralis]
MSSRVIKIKPLYQAEAPEEQSTVTEEEKALQKREEAERKLSEVEQLKKSAQEESDQLRERAQQEIQQAREEWSKEREALIENAKEEGYQAGFNQGLQEAGEQFEEKLEKANRIIDQANESYHQTVQSSEETIVELALRSAEQILGYELDEKNEAFVEVVKRAIQEVQEQPEITVTVHPDQYHHVFSQKEELQRITHSRADLSIYVRDNVDLHGCLIESPFGLIDAGVDQQLKELRQKLFEVVNEELGHE